MFKGEDRSITIPGFTIAAREWGPADGIPVMALHGWVDNASSFEFLAPLLPSAHVVAIDTPGCGRSTHRSEGTIPNIVDEIFHVIQVANALGWQKFTLLGHSRGGALAQLVAAGCPERIESLILLDVVGFYTRPAQPVVPHLRESIKTYFSAPRPATLYRDLDAAAKGRMLASTISFEGALALVKRGTKEVDGGVKWTFDRRELTQAPVIRHSDRQLNDILAGIEAPACVIIALEGMFSDLTMAETRAQLIPNHVLHKVPGHHHVHMDDPQVIAQPINEFLKNLRK